MFSVDEFSNKSKEYLNYFTNKNNESFVIEEGIGKIMISSPHSAEHIRNGEVRPSEIGAGILTRLIHEETGCPVIYKCLNCDDDVNYDQESEYKKQLLQYIEENNIQVLIDMHQLACERSTLINIGTGLRKNLSNRELLDTIVKVFEGIDNIEIDNPFAGKNDNTVSSFISKNANIQSLQLEINSKISNFFNDSIKKEYELYEKLVNLIYTINAKYGVTNFDNKFNAFMNAFDKSLDLEDISIKEIVEKDRDHLYTIYFPRVYNKYFDNNNYVFVLNKSNNKYYNAIAKFEDDLNCNSISLSKSLVNKLDINSDIKESLYIGNYKTNEFSKIYISSIKSLKNDNVVEISGNDELKTLINKYDSFMVYNKINKSNIVVSKSHIKFKNSNVNSIRLSKKYRILLNYEAPLYIDEGIMDLLKYNDIIRYKYSNKNNDIYFCDNDKLPINEEVKDIRNCLLEVDPVCLIPVFDEKNSVSLSHSIFKGITDFFIKKSSISLKAIRPLATDECEDIVRVSATNMNILGVYETEKLILSYKNKKCICRVLPLNNEEELLSNNKPFSSEIAITLPAHIRNELGVDVYSSLKVERDTCHIFYKELSSQLTSYILSILTANPFTLKNLNVFTFANDINSVENEAESIITENIDSLVKIQNSCNFLARVLLFLLILFHVIYLNFSSRRSEVE